MRSYPRAASFSQNAFPIPAEAPVTAASGRVVILLLKAATDGGLKRTMGPHYTAGSKRAKPVGGLLEYVIGLAEDEPHQRPSALSAISKEAGPRYRRDSDLPGEPHGKLGV